MPKKSHTSWKYHNLLTVSIGIGVAVYVSRSALFHQYLLHLGSLSYIGAFVSGILFVSTLTIGTGTVAMVTMSKSLSPLTVAMIAGVGAVIGDFLIMHVVRDTLNKELKLSHNRQLHKIEKLFHSKYFNWILPVIGALIIASPLPDELGVTLIGLTKIRPTQFAILSYVLNTVGIALAIATAKAIGA